MICAGCGLELLPAGGRRGRPARFHNGTCRQRARRARATVRATEALAALDAIETQISELRRAILTGRRPSPETTWRLTRATNDLVQSASHLAGQLVEQPAPEPAGPTVTENVTIAAASNTPADMAQDSGKPLAVQPQPAPPGVTENVTKSGQARVTPTRRSRPARPTPLDLDTVRLDRGDDLGAWRVLAGETERPILVGFLEPAYSGGGGTKRWLARTAGWTEVHGGPWPTRKAALLRLLDSHQRAAGV
jgi:hypothetical protein